MFDALLALVFGSTDILVTYFMMKYGLVIAMGSNYYPPGVTRGRFLDNLPGKVVSVFLLVMSSILFVLFIKVIDWLNVNLSHPFDLIYLTVLVVVFLVSVISTIGCDLASSYSTRARVYIFNKLTKAH